MSRRYKKDVLLLRSRGEIYNCLRGRLHPLRSTLPEGNGKAGERDDSCNHWHQWACSAAFREVPNAEEEEEWDDNSRSSPLLRAHRGWQLRSSEHSEGGDHGKEQQQNKPQTVGAVPPAVIIRLLMDCAMQGSWCNEVLSGS